jgi:hypothetical protein
VKQGGLSSAELYILYIEDLLKSYENSKIGCRIGTITINAVACDDGIALISDNPHDLQILVNQAVQYSITHRYKLQPQKSVVIEVNKKGRNQQDKNLPLKIKMTCLQLKNPHILEYLDLNRTKKQKIHK